MKHLQTFESFLNEAKVVVSFAEETALKKALDDSPKLQREWQVKIAPDKKGMYDGEKVPFAIEVSGNVNNLTDFVNVATDIIGGTPVWTDNNKISDLF
jgi:hypothetical protein